MAIHPPNPSPSPSPPPFRLPGPVPGDLPVTLGIISCNLLAFCALLVAGAGLWHSPNGVQLAWGANFGPATQDGEWWRLLSALFLHFGALHLALNMWALWDAGRLVERMLGGPRTLALYLLAGVFGNLSSLVVQQGRAVSGGASGAVFGIYGALLVCLWAERASVARREFRWIFGGACGFAVAAIAFGYVVPGIDQAAHIGGLAAGAAGALALRRGAPRTIRWLALIGLGSASASLLATLPEPAYRWREEVAARQSIGAFVRDDASIRLRWNDLLREGAAGASFDELAGKIESEVADRYGRSFEQLSQMHLDLGAPSSGRLEASRRYAMVRRDEAMAIVRQLRATSDPAPATKPPNGTGTPPPGTEAAPGRDCMPCPDRGTGK